MGGNTVHHECNRKYLRPDEGEGEIKRWEGNTGGMNEEKKPGGGGVLGGAEIRS